MRVSFGSGSPGHIWAFDTIVHDILLHHCNILNFSPRDLVSRLDSNLLQNGMVTCDSAMLFLNSIGWSPARDVIGVVRMLHIVFWIQFMLSHRRRWTQSSVFSPTLNSSDLAVICASTDVNLIISWLSRDKHRDRRIEILCKYSSRRHKLEGERNWHKSISVLCYSTHRLARLPKFDDNSQMQYIDWCVCLYFITQE